MARLHVDSMSVIWCLRLALYSDQLDRSMFIYFLSLIMTIKRRQMVKQCMRLGRGIYQYPRSRVLGRCR
jgi:hypothetical protein